MHYYVLSLTIWQMCDWQCTIPVCFYNYYFVFISQEFFIPLYFIVILALIRLSIPDSTEDPILVPHGEAQLMDSLGAIVYNNTVHIIPSTHEVCMQKLKLSVDQSITLIPFHLQGMATCKNTLHSSLSPKSSLPSLRFRPVCPLPLCQILIYFVQPSKNTELSIYLLHLN